MRILVLATFLWFASLSVPGVMSEESEAQPLFNPDPCFLVCAKYGSSPAAYKACYYGCTHAP